MAREKISHDQYLDMVAAVTYERGVQGNYPTRLRVALGGSGMDKEEYQDKLLSALEFSFDNACKEHGNEKAQKNADRVYEQVVKLVTSDLGHDHVEEFGGFLRKVHSAMSHSDQKAVKLYTNAREAYDEVVERVGREQTAAALEAAPVIPTDKGMSHSSSASSQSSRRSSVSSAGGEVADREEIDRKRKDFARIRDIFEANKISEADATPNPKNGGRTQVRGR